MFIIYFFVWMNDECIDKETRVMLSLWDEITEGSWFWVWVLFYWDRMNRMESWQTWKDTCFLTDAIALLVAYFLACSKYGNLYSFLMPVCCYARTARYGRSCSWACVRKMIPARFVSSSCSEVPRLGRYLPIYLGTHLCSVRHLMLSFSIVLIRNGVPQEGQATSEITWNNLNNPQNLIYPSYVG